MNKTLLKRNLWQQVRLRPVARRRGQAVDIDDLWIPEDRTKENLKLWNPRTGHHAFVCLEHIHCYDEDGEHGGIKHGILRLKGVCLVLTEKEVMTEPSAIRWNWGVAWRPRNSN